MATLTRLRWQPWVDYFHHGDFTTFLLSTLLFEGMFYRALPLLRYLPLPSEWDLTKDILVSIGSPIHDAIHLIKYNWSRIFLSINQAGIGVISGRVIFAAGVQSETNIKQLSICQRPLCVIHLWVDLLGMWNRYEWRYSYFPRKDATVSNPNFINSIMNQPS